MSTKDSIQRHSSPCERDSQRQDTGCEHLRLMARMPPASIRHSHVRWSRPPRAESLAIPPSASALGLADEFFELVE